MRTSRRTRAIVALVFVTVLWGISFPLMRAINVLMDRAVRGGPAATSTLAEIADRLTRASFYSAVRFAVASAVLAAAMPSLVRRLTRAEWLMGMGVGVPFTAGFLLQVAGLSEIPASRSGFLTSLCVVFTPLLVIAVERRRPRLLMLLGASIALLGTAFLTGLVAPGGPAGLRLAVDATARPGLGDILTVVAAFVFGFQIIVIDVFAGRMPSARLTAGMFLAALIVSATVFLAGAAIRPAVSGSAGWTALLTDGPFLSLTAITSVVCSALAFWLMNAHQPAVSPVQAASIYTLEPVFATLWAMFVPGLISPMIGLDYASERPDLKLALGGAMIVLGNIVSLAAPHGGPPAAAIEPSD